MKKLLFLLGLVSSVAASQMLNAEEPSTEKKFTYKKPVHDKQRPKAPSRQVVSATISGEFITIFFVIDEGEYSLTVTNSQGFVTEYPNLDSSVPTQIHVGNLAGATLEIQTANGNTYVAEI